MKILTVCGMGSGSSLILKMNVDTIMDSLSIDADVEACDIGSVGGQNADLIISTKEFGNPLDDFSADKILVSNVVNKSELEKQLKHYFDK
ncbi:MULTISPECIES: PTS sugar transporter subunit IIB [Enterococcus]|uniref:PTS sugar transporter subunit IIB n=1 Tax=Enterococcus TaxID=1350 RepID=UPI0022E2EAAD|nr:MULTISPECIES: PTS sugar transporter subunit IIB [Enterococcus]MDT2503247.1 PTS sugar transporter subunit IIB [Enterococcus avium]MDT2715003.1 PTS sugar transporter subunit IIB [Enterococcus gallinarum]